MYICIDSGTLEDNCQTARFQNEYLSGEDISFLFLSSCGPSGAANAEVAVAGRVGRPVEVGLVCAGEAGELRDGEAFRSPSSDLTTLLRCSDAVLHVHRLAGSRFNIAVSTAYQLLTTS